MAALRAPGGRMQGAAAQAMSVHIVEPPQRRPRPTYAASGGNGGWARRPPGLAAAAPEARYRGPGSAATRTGAWVLLGSAIVRWAKVARPRMRAIAALLVVDDAHRHRLPPRALRSPHFHSPIWKFARSGTLRVNTHARGRLYLHHGLRGVTATACHATTTHAPRP